MDGKLASDFPAADCPQAVTAVPQKGYPGYFRVDFAPWQLEIDGIHTSFEFDENDLRDLGEVVGKRFPAMQKALLRNSFIMPTEGKAVFGMGCDWYFACRVDGKEIVNALTHGNGFYPIATGNYVFELDLKAGRHEVEFEARSGNLSFLVAFGNVLPCDPAVLNEPFLTDITPDAITVSFATRSSVPAGVDYREAGSSEWKRSWHTIGGQKDTVNRIHRVKLTKLVPDTDYEYRIVTEHPYRGNREDYSKVRTFRSAPESSKPFRVLLIADSQGAYSDREKRIDQVLATPAFARADLLGHIGDYSDSTENIERALFGGLFEKFNGKPMLIVRGNHDCLGKQSALWFSYFGSAMKLMQYGDAVFLTLDCGNYEWRPAPSPQSVNVPEPYWEEQTAWFDKAIHSPEFQNAKFRIVLAHCMPVADAAHDDFMAKHLQTMIDPVLAGANPEVRIDLWIAGHIHCPVRTVPGKSVIVARQTPMLDGASAARYHFPIAVLSGPGKINPPELKMSAMELAFEEEQFTVTHRDLKGDTFDQFRIKRGGEFEELMCREDFQKYDMPHSLKSGK